MTSEENSINVAIKLNKIKYTEVMREFLAHKGWHDEFEIKDDISQISLETGLSIGDQSGRLFVEINYDTDIVDVYIYYNFHCRKSKIDEMIKLINEMHLRFALGRFEVLPDGRIRWRHRVDFEGSVPSGISVVAIVQPGWNCTERFVEPIVAVAMTSQRADQALADFDEAQAKALEQDDDAPREL